mgnify:FL=1
MHGWVACDCHRCSPGSGKFRLGFRLDKFAASCWQCGKVRYFDALSELTGKGYGELRAALGGGLQIQSKPDRPRGVLKIPPGVGGMSKAHRKYLEGRGFDPDEIEEVWGVGGIAGMTGMWSWRLYLPLFQDGLQVSYTTRTIADAPTIAQNALQRYRNAPDGDSVVPARSVLYGEEKARHAVVVVEGPIDAWAIGPGAVALMGLTASSAQVSRLSKFPVRYVCLAGTDEGRRAAERLCYRLETKPGDTHMIDLEGKDVAEASEADRAEIRRMVG